jgi:hypothetical protein
VASGTAGLEASSSQASENLLSGVLAGGEQFEALGDQCTAVRVDDDRADLTALGFRLAHVQVAELGLANGAAVLDLLGHLVADVSTTGVGLVLVDGVDDGLDHGGLGVVAHVEHGRNHPGADFAQVTLDNTSINAVSEDTVEVVNDDVVDVLLLLDPSDHLLERWPLVDIGGGAARFDKLADDVGVKRAGFALACGALGRDRVALGVVVGMHLAWC